VQGGKVERIFHLGADDGEDCDFVHKFKPDFCVFHGRFFSIATDFIGRPSRVRNWIRARLWEGKGSNLNRSHENASAGDGRPNETDLLML